MRIAVIAPTDFMPKYIKGRPVHMVLAHQVLQDDEYARFYRNEQNSYKILDNSLMENGHTAMDIEQVLEAAEIVQADEIVLPDAFRDGPATIMHVLDALETIDALGLIHDYKWAAVVHGVDILTWQVTFQALYSHPHINTLHIPKVMDELWPCGGRTGLCNWLHAYMNGRFHKDIHLLGIWTHPIEVFQLSHFPWIRSLDTALPIHAGIAGVAFDSDNGAMPVADKPKRPSDYFNLLLDNTDNPVVGFNIALLDAMGEYDGSSYPSSNNVHEKASRSALR